MAGNHCMHPVMCKYPRKGSMVHSCSINDTSTSYLCFLLNERAVKQGSLPQTPCLLGAGTSPPLYIYNPA